METIGNTSLWSFLDGEAQAITATCTAIRKGRGYYVESYMELAKKIAELQFRNRDHVLLFRGQTADYLNDSGNTKLKPTLFRPIKAGNPNKSTLSVRFSQLALGERELIVGYEKAKFLGFDRLKRHRILRWSILQHYGICKTPLLDVTHSLRIAASFATHNAEDEAFVFVVGVPNLSGGITASAEAGIQTVRLASVCPPDAMRPHIQEGYLLGEYPEMGDVSQKEHYFHYEMDFGRRLIAKFRFMPSAFWLSETFPPVASDDLYPSGDHDPFQKLASSIKRKIGETV